MQYKTTNTQLTSDLNVITFKCDMAKLIEQQVARGSSVITNKSNSMNYIITKAT